MANGYTGIEGLDRSGLYPDADKIIPYSPRGKFGFTSADRTIKLESMRNMPIDQIIQLYKDGYTVESGNEDNSLSPDIKTAQGVTISNTAILLIGLGLVGYLVYTKKI